MTDAILPKWTGNNVVPQRDTDGVAWVCVLGEMVHEEAGHVGPRTKGLAMWE